jgi:hypothetical protein
MRTIHRRKHGKSLLKGATRLKLEFARDSNVHLGTLTMILLHVRDNARGKQVIPARLVKLGLEDTKDKQNESQSHIERIPHDKGMMRMDDQGTARALIAKITITLLNHTGNDLANLENFMNALTHTMNLMRGITGSTAYLDDHVRKQRPVFECASADLIIITKKSIMDIYPHSIAAAITQIQKLKSTIGEHIVHGPGLRLLRYLLSDQGGCGLHF